MLETFSLEETKKDFITNYNKAKSNFDEFLEEGEEMEFFCPVRSFPNTFLTWLPIVGSMFLLFGLKEYLLGVSNNRVFILRVDNDFVYSTGSIFLKSEVKNCQIENRDNKVGTLKLEFGKGTVFSFKELAIDWMDAIVSKLPNRPRLRETETRM